MAVVLVECAVNAFRVKEQVGIQEVWRLRRGGEDPVRVCNCMGD